MKLSGLLSTEIKGLAVVKHPCLLMSVPVCKLTVDGPNIRQIDEFCFTEAVSSRQIDISISVFMDGVCVREEE